MSNQKKADQMLDDAIQKALRPRSSCTYPDCDCPTAHPELCASSTPPSPHSFDVLPAEQRAELQLYAVWLKLPKPRVPFETYRAEHLPAPPPPSPTQEELHFKMFPSTREGYDQAVAHAKHSPATPSSPEPDIDKELDELSVACRSLGSIHDGIDTQAEYNRRWTRANAAYNALLALYTRQREEIKELIEQLVEDTRQLERLKAEQQEAEDSVASWRRLYVEERDALDLIAMRDTLTDVCQLLDGWHQDGTAWTKWDEEVRQRASTQLKSVYAKLRRLSSDSGTGGEKE